MKKSQLVCTGFLALSIILLTGIRPGQAQFKDYGRPGLGFGIKTGGLVGGTELDGNVDFQVRGYVNHGLTEKFTFEIGGGYAAISGNANLVHVDPATGVESVIADEFRTDMGLVDGRLVFTPITFRNWSPFVYAGIGALRYDLDRPRISKQRTPDTKGIDWATIVPVGAGAKIRLTNRIFTDLTAGYTWTSTDKIDAVARGDDDDFFWGAKLGFELGKDPDPDRDRLFTEVEGRVGTDFERWDTDRDGLSDGDEMRRYKTDPLRPDTDGDGLNDGEERYVYKTDLLKADTDEDGLSDGDEVQIHRTKPLKADTDGDGLNDGAEVNRYRTNPLRADSDFDGLSDADEVNRFKTDPLVWDTDGDGISDGAEIARGTDPLRAEKKTTMEKLKPLVLRSIAFTFGKSELTSEAKNTLDGLVAQLVERPKVKLEILGYSNDSSMRGVKVSQERVDAVKAYLMGRGIAADRLTGKGMGAGKLLAPTTTPEGREKNRRVEFIVR